MSDVKNKSLSTIDQLVSQPYKYGFETEIENERIPVGLDENTVRLLSEKKNEPEFMRKSRLQAFKVWQELTEPNWAELKHPKIDYQGIKPLEYLTWTPNKKLSSMMSIPLSTLTTTNEYIDEINSAFSFQLAELTVFQFPNTDKC